MKFLNHLEEAPPDALFGVQRAFEADPREAKVNLSIGVYKTAELKPLIFGAVKEAERELIELETSKDYLPIGGLLPYIEESKRLVFGETPEEIFGVQSVGGTGALRLAANFLQLGGYSKLYVSNPTWGNHPRIFADFAIESYPHFEGFPEMEPKSVVLLQPCCHNPTGCDPTREQWEEMGRIIKERELFVIFDFAYQGFGDGVEEDTWAIRHFMKLEIPFMVALSHSKNFGLYRERTGALFLRCLNRADVQRLGSQMRVVIRGLYSNPPAHGAQVVAHILRTPRLKKMWLDELNGMRERITEMRHKLSVALRFDFLKKQKGMFSYLHLSDEEIERLRTEFGIYMLAGGRINVAGLNSKNVGCVAKAILNAKKEL